MTEKETAEKYVREKCPELMELSFGCEVYTGRMSPRQTVLNVDEVEVTVRSSVNGMIQDYKFKKMTEFEIIGHPIQLQHWLRVLEDWKFDDFVDFPLHIDWRANWYPQGNIVVTFPKGHPLINKVINFNLTTGQPSTEADYKAFNEIIRAEEAKI